MDEAQWKTLSLSLGTITENPLDDIEVILDEDKLDLIMKDGVIYKNEM